MKISFNWLADYVDLSGVTPEELAERLTLSTAEVEGLETVRYAREGVLVAAVVDVGEVQVNGKYRAVTVELDGGEQAITVSTATNVVPGMHSIYAAPDALLPGGRIKIAKIGGIASVGMLCGAAELGWGASHEGVVEVPRHIRPGTNLAGLLPEMDHFFKIDNKSLTHRPDLWGHYGFAREVAAVLGRALRPLLLADLSRWDDLAPYPLENNAPELCPVLSCIAVDIAAQLTSPLPIQLRLYGLGLRSLGAVIDSTNYLALELGQPTHIYDRDKVGDLAVARAGNRDRFVTLDGSTHELQPDDLLIFGGGAPIGLAGIMGGRDSSVARGTTRLLLESANFTAAGVRRTSVRLGLRTDASQRYEKSQPPRNAVLGLSRLVQLLADSGVRPTAVSRATVSGDLGPEFRTIQLPADEVSRVAGVDIPPQRTESILTALGFGVELTGGSYLITVPAFRSESDISLPIDIVEEVLRVHGYAEIAPRAPTAELGATPVHLGIRRAHRARRVLAASCGFHETESYLWFDDSWLGELGFDPGRTLRLCNPVAPEKARLRTTLLPNLFRAAHDNLDFAGEYAIFEIGHVFPVGTVTDRRSSDPGHSEQQWLSAVYVAAGKTGLETNYRRMKTTLEMLGVAVSGQPLTTTAGLAAGVAWQAAGRWARVRHRDRDIGSIGLLDGAVLDTVARHRQVAWFELDLELIDHPRSLGVTYRPIPLVPGSRQDFSILWPKERPWVDLNEVVAGFESPLISARRFIGRYDGRGLPEGFGSFTYRYWLQLPHRTLTSADLNHFREDLLEYLGNRGLALR